MAEEIILRPGQGGAIVLRVPRGSMGTGMNPAIYAAKFTFATGLAWLVLQPQEKTPLTMTASGVFRVVPEKGIEPSTFSLRMSCSTN